MNYSDEEYTIKFNIFGPTSEEEARVLLSVLHSAIEYELKDTDHVVSSLIVREDAVR